MPKVGGKTISRATFRGYPCRDSPKRGRTQEARRREARDDAKDARAKEEAVGRANKQAAQGARKIPWRKYAPEKDSVIVEAWGGRHGPSGVMCVAEHDGEIWRAYLEGEHILSHCDKRPFGEVWPEIERFCLAGWDAEED